MASVEDLATTFGWPAGLADTVVKSNDTIAFRFVLVDNSRSMVNIDGHQLLDNEGGPSYEKCTRWEEVSGSVRSIARLADAVLAPTEIRLLNNAVPVVILGKENDGGINLAVIMDQLDGQPIGQTPIAKQLGEIVDQIKAMEDDLRANNKIAVLIIMTDGKASDGCTIDAMKPLEGMPVQMIIRVCSTDRDIIEYWDNVNAELDIDVLLLNDLEAEGANISKNNNWLTYGMPLHRAREFGVIVPEIDNLNYRPLTRPEIKIISQIL